MKNKNIYGFISRGKIFDIMDRAALDYVRDNYNEKDSYIFTGHSRISFLKQLSNLKNYSIHIRSDERGMIAGKRWEIYTKFYSGNEKTLIAEAFFEFEKSKHNSSESN